MSEQNTSHARDLEDTHLEKSAKNSPVTKRAGEWVLYAPVEPSQRMLGSFGWTKTIMVTEKSVTVVESKKITCTLVEEDIPGAALPRESVEKCSMVQLKRWLTCRGAKTSGKKSALVFR